MREGGCPGAGSIRVSEELPVVERGREIERLADLAREASRSGHGLVLRRFEQSLVDGASLHEVRRGVERGLRESASRDETSGSRDEGVGDLVPFGERG